MTKSEKKKVITTNAGIWVAGILASFILPMVAESTTEGRSAFLKMMAHGGSLAVALLASTTVISKAIGDPTE